MATLTPEQKDLCSGLALFYMGPDGEPDEYVHRLRRAMDSGDLDEAEHVSALLLSLLFADKKAKRWMSEQWVRVWRKPLEAAPEFPYGHHRAR